MGYDSTLRKKVRKLAKTEEGRISEKDIYKSETLRKYLNTMSAAILGDGYTQFSTVTVEQKGIDGYTAYTDGKQTFINSENELIVAYSEPENRFLAFLGHFYHETAHRVFLDFDELNRGLEELSNGKMYGAVPTPAPEQQKDFDELTAAIADPDFQKVIHEVYSRVLNACADPHDEDAMIRLHGHLATEPIFKIRASILASCLTIEDQLELVEKGKLDDLSVMFNLILQYVRYESISGDPSVLAQTKYAPVLRSISKYAAFGRDCDDLKDRFGAVNYIVLGLWPFIQKAKEEAEKRGESPSEAAQSILNSLTQGANGAGQTAQPQSLNSSQQAIASRGQSGSNGAPDPGNQNQANATAASQSNDPNGKDAQEHSQVIAESIYREIKERCAEEKAEQKAEKEAAQALTDEVQAVNQNSGHKGRSVSVKRNLTLTQADYDRYASMMATLTPYSKRIQKGIQEALRDLSDRSVSRHRSFGPIICAEDSYRPDQKYFAKKHQPGNLPELAIGVLVDLSGSMGNLGRIQAAMRASMLLEHFARGLNIPVCVTGHNTTNRGIAYHIFCDFDRAGDKDPYRLATMRTGSCNRDGMAIEIAAAHLTKRPEDVKILFIISDGRPNDDGYGMDEAKKDIQSIMKRYQRQGVEFIAAAIGDDKPFIKTIYGDSFLDITNLDTLPKTMVKMVKKRVLSVLN